MSFDWNAKWLKKCLNPKCHLSTCSRVAAWPAELLQDFAFHTLPQHLVFPLTWSCSFVLSLPQILSDLSPVLFLQSMLYTSNKNVPSKRAGVNQCVRQDLWRTWIGQFDEGSWVETTWACFLIVHPWILNCWVTPALFLVLGKPSAVPCISKNVPAFQIDDNLVYNL